MGQGRSYPLSPRPALYLPSCPWAATGLGERRRQLLTPRTLRMAFRSGLRSATPGNLPADRCRGSQAGMAPHQADRDTYSVQEPCLRVRFL